MPNTNELLIKLRGRLQVLAELTRELPPDERSSLDAAIDDMDRLVKPPERRTSLKPLLMRWPRRARQ